MGSELDLNDVAHGNRLALEELAKLRRAERERDELLAALTLARDMFICNGLDINMRHTFAKMQETIEKVKS